MNVSHNQLSGTIPEISTVVYLSAFDVSYNILTGSIPDPSSLQFLSEFNVGANMLTGAVPPAPTNPYAAVVLCPNPLDTTPGPYDGDWSASTGYSPWWATPYASNACDDLFTSQFDS